MVACSQTATLRTWLRAAAALGLCLLTPGPVRAQVGEVGGLARSVALGGGGVALADADASPIVNPAALALPVGTRFGLSRLGMSARGATARRAWRRIIESGNFDTLGEIALDLSRNRNIIAAEGGFDARFGHWQIDLGLLAQAEGDPNAPLRQWVRQGAAFFPPPDARLVAQYGYLAIPSVAYGHRWSLPAAGGTLDGGVRLNVWTGRYIQDRFRANSDFEIIRHTAEDETGVSPGIDLGLRFIPSATPELSYGLVVRGLIEPSIGEMRQQRTVDIGGAWRPGRRLTLVMDALNLTSANDRHAKLSAGAEYRIVPRWLALRAAVTTRGLAGGVALGPLQVAFNEDGETTLGTQIGF